MKAKRNFKHFGILAGLATLMPLLTGCVRTTSSGKPYGFVYNYLAVPGQKVMDLIANYVHSYGVAIIVLTIIVRLVLMPLMISQMKKMTVMQEKISYISPQLKILQKRLKTAKTPQERMTVNQQMMALYRNNNINMLGGIGCLPLLIQLPIFAALYAAIRYSRLNSTFLGINLRKTSLLLAVLSFLIYVVQGYISLIGVPKSQKKQMKMMMLFSPFMILVVTLSSPAGLGLYFFIGGVFACLQTFIINLYRPRIRAKVAAYAKKHPVKPIKLTPPSNDNVAADGAPNSNLTNNDTSNGTSPTNDSSTLAQDHEANRKRNQGKQHRD